MGQHSNSPDRLTFGFETAQLDIIDFDGTMFDTFEAAPPLAIYGVDEVYRMSIEEAFVHDKDAIRRYEEHGEHQNRSPYEIVQSLAPEASVQELEELTSTLVGAKLATFEKQIGKPLNDGAPWPRPVPGFMEYSLAISEANLQGHHIDRAILSAGHASFIRKCLEMTGISPPEIMISEETIRGLNSTLPHDRLTKPSVLPFLLAKLQWLHRYELADIVNTNAPAINERIIMIGDSDTKDGGLARNAGVDFVHITSEDSKEAWRSVITKHHLGAMAIGATRT